MASFKFKASQADGKIVTGVRDGENREVIVQALQNQGLIVISVEESFGFSFRRLTQVEVGDISLKDKVIFARQLATMLDAGLPVVQALEILIEQTQQLGLKKKLTEVYKDVQSGLPLSASFKKYKVIFSDLQVSLIEAGEKSGNLVEIMKQIAEDLQKSADLKGKIQGALIYPAIIFIAIIIVVVVLVVYMIPAVEGLYKDLGGGELPAITQFLVTVSNFVTNPLGLLAILVIVVGAIIGFRSMYKSLRGRKLIDRIILRLPVFGDLISKMQVLETTRLLGMLLKSGLPIIDALNATAKSLSNIHFRIALQYAAQEVAKGSPIAIPLAKSRYIPLIVVKMIATGEETGSLDKILVDLTRFYEEQVEEITSNLTKLMEPLILLIVGGLVGFLAVAVYYPIYNIANITQS